MIRIAINGFGRIGRIFFRQAFLASAQGGSASGGDLDIVAINDLGTPENLAYLLKYDTVYGRYEKEVTVNGNKLVIGPASHEASADPRSAGGFGEASAKALADKSADGKHEVLVLSEKDPASLPWKDLGVDIVIESTGVFDSRDKAVAHLDAGAKRVVITAPAKDEITPTATPGILDNVKLDKITSNASCTTNAVNPVMAIMMANPGVKKAVLTTVHGYTATQGLVDGPDKKGDFRRARAAAQNIVPSTTGAAESTARVLPGLKGKFDGLAIRVPIISGSLIDITFVAERPTSIEEINNIFKEAAARPEWQGILTVTEDPIVSSDILRNPHGSIIDLALTRVVDGDLVKVFSWYDNEWGYCAMLLKHVLTVAQIL